MSDHIAEAGKMVCPNCGAEKHDPDDDFWTCGSHQDGYRDRPCLQREPLWRELCAMRTANKALVKRVKRLEHYVERLHSAGNELRDGSGDDDAIYRWRAVKRDNPLHQEHKP